MLQTSPYAADFNCVLDFEEGHARTKGRMAELDTKIRYKDDAGDVDQLEHPRLAASRLRELAAAVGPHLANSDWHRVET